MESKAQKVKRKLSPKLKYMKNNYGMYFMLAPGLILLLIFTYVPMFGLYMAFVDYQPSTPIWECPNVGFLNFQLMFEDPLLWKMVRNTLVLSTLKIVFNFSLTIVLALLVNELQCKRFKNTFQSISYLPNFISWVIVSGMLTILLDSDSGFFNRIIEWCGGDPVSWYAAPQKWYAILTVSGIWKGIGWGTIMYIAAMTSIDPQLYEAAVIDGAGRLRQTFHVTLPGISGIISITLVLTIGKIFTDDFEQIYALVGANDILAETTAVFSTKIFQYTSTGRYDMYPVSTAMGLMQGIISLILVLISNYSAKKLGQESLW